MLQRVSVAGNIVFGSAVGSVLCKDLRPFEAVLLHCSQSADCYEIVVRSAVVVAPMHDVSGWSAAWGRWFSSCSFCTSPQLWGHACLNDHNRNAVQQAVAG